MQSTQALNIPHPGRALSPYRVAVIDVLAGLMAVNIWGRLGWRETKRRYRRTAFGPFWTTVSIALFVTTLGLVWSNLWHKDPKAYLPYLTAGMILWVFILSICTEGCAAFTINEKLIKQLRISYTLLACVSVWRNVTVILHNLTIYILVCVYAGLYPTWATLLVIPAFALLCLNAVWVVALLAAMCARYRDMQQLVANILQISLFLTPIFWAPEQLTGRAAVLMQFNPLYHLIAVVRQPLLGEVPSATHWAAVIGMAICGWTLTIYVMGNVRHRIVYWL
ncbi:MAG TPA: ABC transporter permease [Burkholderiaceae bacterium]|nr:ABC transporter permease [Burkholderiaceae bacterium]